MRIEETKRLGVDELRDCCVDNNYFNAGNKERYFRLFEMVSNTQITNRILYRLAEYIYTYTEFKHRDYFSSKELLELIMCELGKRCVSTYEIIED